ncbi:hypothetical protein J6590_010940 [Homalodisca vitripennis]|nr:hypothetical protein J6590_010940 [Homalodisca vitripennis]
MRWEPGETSHSPITESSLQRSLSELVEFDIYSGDKQILAKGGKERQRDGKECAGSREKPVTALSQSHPYRDPFQNLVGKKGKETRRNALGAERNQSSRRSRIGFLTKKLLTTFWVVKSQQFIPLEVGA